MRKLTICFAFILSMIGIVNAQSVVNPGFETGALSPWTIWQPAGGGLPQLITTNVHTGTYAAQVGTGRCSLEQIVTGLKPWTQYTLTAWVKVLNVGDTVTVGVKLFRGTTVVEARPSSTSYTKYTLSFITGGSNTKATIYFFNTKATGTAFGDDFEITENTPPARSNYYIDNISGNDSNTGKSPVLAWKTITKVNGKIFSPGDSILFKNDGTWTGTLHPQGEGATGKPIVISNYGSGAAKPLFNGNGAVRTVYLSNQQYFEITNLEVTNSVNPGSSKRGIEVENINRGKLTHIKIFNNNVHDVLGDNNRGQDGSIGIMVVVRKGSSGFVPSWFDTVAIENNIVKKVNRTAIGSSSDWRCQAQWGCTTNSGYYPTTNMVIRNNYVEDAGGDGIVPMVCYATLVEHNIVNGANKNSGTANAGMWCYSGNKNLFQYNEAYNVKTAIDGEGYDVDFAQDSTIFQYNYSHDNDGGFMLLCTNIAGANTNATVRYNISQNDKYRIMILNGNVQNARIYNNTMYLPTGSTSRPIVIDNWGGEFPKDIYIQNNIFQLTDANQWVAMDSISGTKVFDYNIIYGVHTTGEPTGPHNIFTDPLLTAPGTGTTGGMVSGTLTFGNVDGYKLQAGSPAIGAGTIISGNGGMDYWGNAVGTSSAPNIGAYNGTPVSPQLRKNSFRGEPASKKVQLNWLTDHEEQISHFILERSIDGSVFKELTMIPAKARAFDYESLDYNPVEGKVYYRLNTISKENKTIYSETIPVNYKSQQSGLLCFPNPIKTGQQLSISYISTISGPATVYIRSIMGNNIYQSKLNVSKGKNDSQIILPNIRSGNYLVQISNGTDKIIGKVNIVE
ncbi:carbohydrate binding domain-containing protein [Mucilaginibacter sabulilitoris]|uniref:Carbohydrate binding domain-containing protein n=1 Tax=Mucilaginibacter sabulilitoris TaxID=1173583 RepID=A0ABZ0TRZ9_9SPHI|nr:carbohydrate binding domain-containing protein [Mucilaginibacter sabulilitoris]WPU95541.1 carbohydrate binding domain-containing protein [Mucilaginibacter sabulilitoris]